MFAAFIGAAPALAQGVQPKEVTKTLPPLGSATVEKTVETTALPPNSDFVFLADTTGSMGPSIEDVKTNAQTIIDALEAAGATNALYGVANYRDFTSTGPCDYGTELDTDLTDATAAKAAIDTWFANNGCDIPEANFLALHQIATSELGISWRSDSTKFIIWFGDAPSHDPICPELPGNSDPHTVTEASVTADLVGADIHVIAATALSGPGLDADPKPFSGDYVAVCGPEQGTAGQATRIAAATGGVHLINPPGSSIAETILDAIEALPPIPTTVTPVANCDVGLTVTFNPPFAVVDSGDTATFQETITVTSTTAPATLHCTVDFLINGANAGEAYRQTITVHVVPGPPATVTLEPKTGVNPVGDQHCVTATVRDAFGNPVPGATVDFTTTGGATPPSGSATTNSEGKAQFCFTGPSLPGTVTITATVRGTMIQDTATKSFVLPQSTEGCKVTQGGWIVTTAGNRANFGGNAHVPPKGEQNYQDKAMNLHVKSINVVAVMCSADGTSASIFGTAKVNGAGSFDYRIDVRDLGEPGTTDRYRIRLSNGYDSGDQQLVGGNVQIHTK
jgi:hypothetical protein